jgi:protein phosphatase
MQIWSITDPGCVRTQNQDAYKIEELDKFTLLCVVCDGMGGAKSGNVASSLAVDVFTQEMRSSYHSGMDQRDVEDLLRRAVKLTNFTVYDQAREVEDFAGMGTTLVAALIRGKEVTVVNVGDSRAYLIDSEGIRMITTDHSLVQMMVQRGELLPEQAKQYPGKNLITRAIGTETTVQCDLFQLEMERENVLLLCTDGLSNLLDDQELLFEVVHRQNRQDCCQRLLDIAKNRGAPDNVTCVLLQF